MGYSGLEHWVCSDGAADMVADIEDALYRILNKELKNKGNELNTDGPTNVALYFEAFLLPTKDEWHSVKLEKLAIKVIYLLENKVKMCESNSGWDSEKNRKYHIKSFKRLIKSLNKFLDKRG